MAPSFPSPVASTSRIPYTSSSSPFSTARPFTSSAPRSARRGGAHLIHPMVRQRLTNLTFALAGLLSVATVSLTMSGSLVEAPCPARRTAGAAMQQEREERLARQASARADGGWWKSKGRFLEDPLPIAPTAPAPAVTWSAARGVQAASRAEEQPKEVEQERIARPAAEAKNWRNWGGATATLTLPALPPQSTSLDFSSDSDAPTYRTRASHFTARSLLKPEYVPAVPLPSSPSTDDRDGEGDEKGGVDTAAVRDVSPLDSLRRGNTMMQLIGAGALSLGSTLVISLYVTGPPRLNDMATASTAVLFMTLLLGCLACVPSWFAALLILCGEKPQPLEPPPHGKVLRLATLIAFFVAALYSVATLVLFVLLQAKDSFVSFCMQNIPSATDEACKARWDRDWVIILVVGIVWIYHIALGFPVYRYTRGTEYGRQLKSGFLLEEGKPQRSSLQRRLSQWADSSSDSDFLPPKRAARRELDPGKAARSEKRRRREGRTWVRRSKVEEGVSDLEPPVGRRRPEEVLDMGKRREKRRRRRSRSRPEV